MALDPESLKALVDLEEDMKKLPKGADGTRRTDANKLYGKGPSPEERLRIDTVKEYFSSGGGGMKSRKPSGPPQSSKPSIDVKLTQKSTELCKVLAKSLDSAKIKWAHVVFNMHWLSQTAECGGTYYAHFFDELEVLWANLRPEHLLQLKAGLENQLVKLSGQSDKINSLGNYKGAAAEFIDAVRAAVIRQRILTKIEIPEAMKKIAEDLTQAEPDAKSKKVLSAQDIDRIEIYTDGTKVYIEVKADVETAIDKHGKGFAKLQLLQILNVIATAERKDLRKGQDRQRLPAVSVVNYTEWLRLFTAGTAQIYASLGFYLLIGGVCFSPDQLRRLHSVVARESLGREKEFFHANIGKFPAPSVVLGGMDDLPSLLQLSGLPPPGISSHGRFAPSDLKNVWDPKKDPIVIKSNQPTGRFGPIGPPSSSRALVLRSSSPSPRMGGSVSGLIGGPVPSSSSVQTQLDELIALQLYLEQLHKESSGSDLGASKKLAEESSKLVTKLKFTHTFHSIAGDGNCLFRALSFLRYGTQDRHKLLRELAVVHMRQYRVFFSGIDAGITVEYLNAMYVPARDASERHRWGGCPELYAISRLLRTPIIVHHPSFGGGQLEICERDDALFTPLPSRPPLHLYFKGGNHYEAMKNA